MRLKVLLVTMDLYNNIGGGETVYRKIVESAPDIDFYYFSNLRQTTIDRPPNAIAIPLAPPSNLQVLCPPPFPKFKLCALNEANRIASSVAGMEFDIVDCADFFDFGSMLRVAFRHHNISVKRIVLAMHGSMSTSIRMQWGSPGDNVSEHQAMELAQFEAADGIYGISPRYIEEWTSRIPRDVHFINPLNFINLDKSKISTPLKTYAKNAGLPNLYCIGRMERRKGNDLFIEIISWLNPSSFGNAKNIGDLVTTSEGLSIEYILKCIAQKRCTEVDFGPSLSHGELQKLLADKSVVILPTRYDSLNLVALESLFAGCPTIISEKAGVCDFLDRYFPEIPYIKIDFDDFYSVISKLENLLANYDTYRTHLETQLQCVTDRLDIKLNISSIYRAILGAPPRQSDTDIVNLRYQETAPPLTAYAKQYARLILSDEIFNYLKKMMIGGTRSMKSIIRKTKYFYHAVAIQKLLDAWGVAKRLAQTSGIPEQNVDAQLYKLRYIYSAATNPLYRCNFWKDIARIERQIGHDMIAATYELRLLRLVSKDKLGILPNTVKTLRQRGLSTEADAAIALYANPDQTNQAAYSYLKDAYNRNLTNQALPFETISERRQGTPRVSVIVSLYNAASKLKFFLNTLKQQTLICNDPQSVEIILIDSGSPTNEGEIMHEYWDNNKLNAVYARSAKRETIQAAWNRGIHLARAPYVVFLGVDEGIYPKALEVLAHALDNDSQIDWAMADSLVTEVDARGVYKNDVMIYDRKGATKDHVYLETCYLSWVGGMYRKNIHDRYGYYDESFTGAGDTEFKNRILPFIQVKFLPEMLGLFLNYPEDRTTASSRVEIEDLRAWYIHRTPAGVRYAFENRAIEDIEKIFLIALAYRKSYCGHVSTDIEYAKYLADYLIERGSKLPYLSALAKELGNMLHEFQSLELVEQSPSGIMCFRAISKAWSQARHLRNEHIKYLPHNVTPAYNLFNDNRYEQHSWLWKSFTPPPSK